VTLGTGYIILSVPKVIGLSQPRRDTFSVPPFAERRKALRKQFASPSFFQSHRVAGGPDGPRDRLWWLCWHACSSARRKPLVWSCPTGGLAVGGTPGPSLFLQGSNMFWPRSRPWRRRSCSNSADFDGHRLIKNRSNGADHVYPDTEHQSVVDAERTAMSTE